MVGRPLPLALFVTSRAVPKADKREAVWISATAPAKYPEEPFSETGISKLNSIAARQFYAKVPVWFYEIQIGHQPFAGVTAEICSWSHCGTWAVPTVEN